MFRGNRQATVKPKQVEGTAAIDGCAATTERAGRREYFQRTAIDGGGAGIGCVYGEGYRSGARSFNQVFAGASDIAAEGQDPARSGINGAITQQGDGTGKCVTGVQAGQRATVQGYRFGDGATGGQIKRTAGDGGASGAQGIDMGNLQRSASNLGGPSEGIRTPQGNDASTATFFDIFGSTTDDADTIADG